MRRQLDRRFAGIDAAIGGHPLDGWIRTIRRALGMSTPELADRMSISQQRAWKLEKAEVDDSIRLSTLRRAARALNCELVYLFVPNEPLEDMVLRQAQRKAEVEFNDAVPCSSDRQALAEDGDEWIGLRSLELIDSRGLWRSGAVRRHRDDPI